MKLRWNTIRKERLLPQQSTCSYEEYFMWGARLVQRDRPLIKKHCSCMISWYPAKLSMFLWIEINYKTGICDVDFFRLKKWSACLSTDARIKVNEMKTLKSSSLLGFPGPTLNNVFFFFFFVRLSFTSKCYVSGCNKCGKQVKMETPFGLVLLLAATLADKLSSL